MKNIKEILPSKCSKLIDSLEIILITETLTGTDYNMIINSHNFVINIESLNTLLTIPSNVSEFYPAYINISQDKLKKINDFSLFEQEIKENEILISKVNQKRTSFGYTLMSSGRMVNLQPFCKFLFPKQEKLYNFYLICKKHGIF